MCNNVLRKKMKTKKKIRATMSYKQASSKEVV